MEGRVVGGDARAGSAPWSPASRWRRGGPRERPRAGQEQGAALAAEGEEQVHRDEREGGRGDGEELRVVFDEEVHVGLLCWSAGAGSLRSPSRGRRGLRPALERNLGPRPGLAASAMRRIEENAG